METETKKKRTYTVPVLLVLLTFSLIGNVLLYTLKLQNGQDQRQAEGEAIINAGLGAKAHVQEVMSLLDKLAASSSAEERAGILYGMGHAFVGTEQVYVFIEEAENHSVPQQATNGPAANSKLDAIGNTLGTIGTHAGPLTAEESKYVQQVTALYAKLEEQLAGFTLDPEDKMVAMTAQAGGAWVESGLKLQEAIEQSAVGNNGQLPKQ